MNENFLEWDSLIKVNCTPIEKSYFIIGSKIWSREGKPRKKRQRRILSWLYKVPWVYLENRIGEENPKSYFSADFKGLPLTSEDISSVLIVRCALGRIRARKCETSETVRRACLLARCVRNFHEFSTFPPNLPPTCHPSHHLRFCRGNIVTRAGILLSN